MTAIETVDRPLTRILLAEDQAKDAELAMAALDDAGMNTEVLVVSDEEGFRRELEVFRPDVILSDYLMPGFGGLEALQIAQRVAPLVPFIFVSGVIGDYTAIEAVRAGATDYVLKDRLIRLPGAVSRALSEAHQREAYSRAVVDSGHRLAAVEQAAESILITDLDGRIEYANPATTAVSGYPLAELIGRTPRLFKSGEQSEEIYQELWRTIKAGQPWKGRVVNRRKDGSHYTEDLSISPVRNEAGVLSAFVAVKRDVTRELELEAQLVSAQKLQLVGRLAGGVAHDFNNTLVVILLQAELAMAGSDPESAVYRRLDEIRAAAQRAAAVTSHLQTFAQRRSFRSITLDVNTTVEGTLRFLRPVLRENIELEWEPADNLDSVVMDPGLLEAAIAKLVLNSRDALSGPGRITVATHRRTDTGRTRSETAEWVVITVRDNGRGIAADRLQALFDPIAAMEREGGGTGLGLPMIKQSVEQVGGFIEARSEPDLGTVFELWIPMAAVTQPIVAEDRESEPPAEAQKTVLLVEDDPSVLSATEQLLSHLGYQVVTAQSGPEALAHVEQLHIRPDVLVTDLTMPVMGGIELAGLVRTHLGRLPVVLLSGYADVPVLEHARKLNIRFLAKPFTRFELGAALRDALEVN